MKLLALICLMLAVGCVGVNGMTAPPKFVKHLSGSSVALVVTLKSDDGAENVKPYCSGTWISEREVLTAAHCVVAIADHLNMTKEDVMIHYVNDYDIQEIGKEPYGIHLAKVKVVDEESDLAVLTALGTRFDHQVAELSSGLPEVGEAVWNSSTPTGKYFSFMGGTVSGIRSADVADMKGEFIQVAMPVWFGSSGSALFNSRGEVLGVCSRLAGSPGMSYFAAVNKKTIAELEKDK